MNRASVFINPFLSRSEDFNRAVYLYLATVDEATISELQSTLDMQQLALFPTLDTLEGEGLIKRNGETFTATA